MLVCILSRIRESKEKEERVCKVVDADALVKDIAGYQRLSYKCAPL